MCHMHVKLKLDDPITDMQCGRVKGYVYVPFEYECKVPDILIYFSLLSQLCTLLLLDLWNNRM